MDSPKKIVGIVRCTSLRKLIKARRDSEPEVKSGEQIELAAFEEAECNFSTQFRPPLSAQLTIDRPELFGVIQEHRLYKLTIEPF